MVSELIFPALVLLGFWGWGGVWLVELFPVARDRGERREMSAMLKPWVKFWMLVSLSAKWGSNPKYSWEGLMLKLKLQYFGHLIRRADSLEKTLMMRKIEGRRRRGDRGWDGWMASPTQWTWVWANSGRQWRTGNLGVQQSMGSQRVEHLATEQTKMGTIISVPSGLFWGFN